MKAFCLRGHADIKSAPLVMEDRPVPSPGEGQVLVRVLACGLCHTDLHVIEGDLPARPLPVVPGHQVVGVVESLGPGPAVLRPGSRVGIPWLNHACAACAPCRAGSENLCEHGRFTGYDVDGGFAEYLVVDQSFAHQLPAGMGDEAVAPLLCGGTIGYRALTLSGVPERGHLGLYGFGSSAHIVIQLARYLGYRVSVFTRGVGHRELARELGAEVVGGAEDAAPASLDAAIVFAPAGWIVPLALKSVRPGGTVTLAGIHMSPLPRMDYSLIWGERVLRSVANSTRKDVADTLRLAAEAKVESHVQVFPIESANEALLALKEGRIDGSAVLSVRG